MGWALPEHILRDVLAIQNPKLTPLEGGLWAGVPERRAPHRVVQKKHPPEHGHGWQWPASGLADAVGPNKKKSLGGSTVEEYEVDYLLHRQEWGRKEIERQAASSRFAGLGLRRHQRGP